MGADRKAVKGRGASEQVSNRFSQRTLGPVHWEGIDEVTGEEGVPTKYLFEQPRSILNEVKAPDLGFRWSLNPYQGCEHGCSYCYARPTHEYWGYSAGLDFERVIMVKRNAPSLLEKALRDERWTAEPVMMSGATDPYQPIERTEGLTRQCLEVFLRFEHPVQVITKNALILRDLDILTELASKRLVSVAISLTTLNEDLRRIMEPRTATAARRSDTIRALSEAGVPVHAMLAPLIPSINDHEVPALLKAASEAGASSAGYTVLRTNGPVEKVFRNWLELHFPDRAAKVIAQTSAMHGGSMGDSEAGRRLRGEGPFALSIRRTFNVFRQRYFSGRHYPGLDRTRFHRPPEGQLDLFDQHGYADI
ncbi:MAG: PA0069 family radical SAM protein [Flavobacteriales bacterium]|nr:PA0069 family radical SAM protein [Flavobacteriales bacterium]